MRFKPGHRLRFVTADGVELIVKPFFYTSGTDHELKYQLLTDDGVQLNCVEDGTGIYQLGDSETLVYLKGDTTPA